LIQSQGISTCFDSIINLTIDTISLNYSFVTPQITNTAYNTNPVTFDNIGTIQQQDLCSVTSVHEIEKEIILLYPNPASEIITFSQPLEDISIYSVDGNIIKRIQGYSDDVDVSDMQNGIYYLMSGECRSKFIIFR
jgi:hypothetical protein